MRFIILQLQCTGFRSLNVTLRTKYDLYANIRPFKKNAAVDTPFHDVDLVPSANIGKGYAMFEAVHGSVPDIAGKNMANPTALCWAACMLLDHIGEKECADRIRKAIDEVLAEGTHLTRDLKGTATTSEYVEKILKKLA